jgi:hypothetical protein
VRFVRWPAPRAQAPGVFLTSAAAGALAMGALVIGAGPALATVQAAPLTGSSAAPLYQVNAGEWQTTVYFDTAALCAGKKPAGNKFSLVTGKPSTVTGAVAPAYPDGTAKKTAKKHSFLM